LKGSSPVIYNCSISATLLNAAFLEGHSTLAGLFNLFLTHHYSLTIFFITLDSSCQDVSR